MPAAAVMHAPSRQALRHLHKTIAILNAVVHSQKYPQQCCRFEH